MKPLIFNRYFGLRAVCAAVVVAATALTANAEFVARPAPSGLSMARPKRVYYCSVSNAALNFGNYSIFSTSPDTASTTIVIPNGGCLFSNKIRIKISLSQGNSNPNYNPRTLLNGASSMNYNLYLDNAYSTIWGNGSNGTQEFSQTLNCPYNLCTISGGVPVYGSIPALQNVPPGTYTDTITITLQFN